MLPKDKSKFDYILNSLLTEKVQQPTLQLIEIKTF